MGTQKQEYCTVGVLIYVDYIGYNSLLPVHTYIYKGTCQKLLSGFFSVKGGESPPFR